MKMWRMAACLTLAMSPAWANETEALEIQVGGLTAIVTNNSRVGSCVGNGCSAVQYFGGIEGMSVAGSIGGWQFEIYDTGLNLHVAGATCVGDGCTAAPLTVLYSDVGYTAGNALTLSSEPGPFFVVGCGQGLEGVTIDCGAGQPGPVDASAFFDAGNALFGETTSISGEGVPPSSLYSVTLSEVFHPNPAGGTATLSGVSLNTPEPRSLALQSTVAMLWLGLLRRRWRRRNRVQDGADARGEFVGGERF